MNFIERFLEYTENAESPTSFFKWAAYAIVAAVLRDNVYLNLGVFTVYPNIYVLLIAPSAEHRKSVPLGLASKYVRLVGNTKLISGRTSIQAVIEDLAIVETNKKTGEVIKGGACLLCAEELAAFFVDDPQTVKILTDLYDAREEYTSRLKSSGKIRITKLCVSMLAASNETFLKEVYTQKAVFGGLMGRTFFVKPDEFRPANTLFDFSKSDDKMVNSLLAISKVQGPIEVTQEAKKEYTDWYIPFRESYKNKPDNTGVVGRIHIGILKLAIILAINDTCKPIIEAKHIRGAIEEVIKLLPNYKVYSMLTGKSNLSEIGALFLEYLWAKQNKQASRNEILARYWIDVDVESFDKIVNTLDQAGMITRVYTATGEIYKMTEKCMKIFEEDKNGNKSV